MSSVAYAFSVHHFIDSVGADAGFAAFIGLALLVLLYFAQARETSTLREQAYESAQRVQQLEARLALLGRQQEAALSSQQPTPPPPGLVRPLSSRTAGRVPQSAAMAAPAVATAPAAPAMVAAPALSAATRLITLNVPAPATAVSPFDGSVAEELTADGNGTLGSPTSYAGGRASDLGPPPPRVTRAPYDVGQPSRGGAPPPRLDPDPEGEPPRGRRGLIFLLGGLLAAGIVAVVLIVDHSGSAPASPPTTTTTSAQRPPHRHTGTPVLAQVTPANVVVAVLNGTDTTGLAGRISQRLGTDGYKLGNVTNAAEQTHATTIVAYKPGSQDAALAVAKSLGLSSTAVHPLDQGTEQVACANQAACTLNVVVTVGADLASSA